MKNDNEIRELLDRLRGELRSSQDAVQAPAAQPAAGQPQAAPPRERPERRPAAAPFARAARREPPAFRKTELGGYDAPRPASGDDAIWIENKEAMLLGVLASLAAALGGALSGLGYLAVAGTASFLLFSCAMALALFGRYLNFREGPSAESRNARLEQLALKLDSLEEKLASVRASAEISARPADAELERKVEELRKVVRSLSRAVDGGGND
ncbi:MAG TPA: hypothetical protein PL037_00720 [Elusimicrobiales bacterium]|nr:hypothetical protein [Elusimicrobiales bacterium]